MRRKNELGVTDRVARNRSARKWSRNELIGRAIWALVQPFFRYSPRQFWAWRRWILRLFGARVAPDVHIFPSVRIAIPWNLEFGPSCAVGDRVNLYSLGRITIGAGATVSQFAHLCAGTHDYRDPAMPLVKATITVGPDAWICADAFLGPGVKVGSRAIVAARAVVICDVEAETIVGGNPAYLIKQRPPLT